MCTLETERLHLRMFRADDLTAYTEIFSDLEVMRFLGDGKPISREEAWRHLAIILGTWRLRGYGIWAVEEKESGLLLGRVGFIHPEGWPGLELAWSLGRPFWGKGYATEAARACLDYGFREAGMEHVISLVHPDNHRSRAVAQRLGEVKEGTTDLRGTEVEVFGIRRSGSQSPS